MNLNNKMVGGLIAGVVMGSLLVYTVPKYVDIDLKTKTKQEENVNQFQFKQEEQTESNIEKAYEYIKNNLQLNVTGSSSIDMQQTEEGLVLVITYTDEISKAIEKNGVTEEALKTDGENIINQIVLPIKQELQNNNIDCPIAVVFQLSSGDVVMITQDDEILEMHPIDTPVKEEYAEKKSVINQRC